MARSDLTELVFLLDRSGSMAGLESDTIGGFNSVLERNRTQPGDALVTTVLFDHEALMLHDRQAIAAVKPLSAEDYRVRGCTALLDAVGSAIHKIDNAHAHIAEEYRPGKVQFVIVTDGLENASYRFSPEEIQRLILDKRKQGWDFLFLGANMDAITTAKDLGIHPDRAVNAMADSVGVPLQYEAVARATVSYRAGEMLDADWKADVERDSKARSHF